MLYIPFTAKVRGPFVSFPHQPRMPFFLNTCDLLCKCAIKIPMVCVPERSSTDFILDIFVFGQISTEEEAVVTLLGAYGEDGGRMHGMQENEVLFVCCRFPQGFRHDQHIREDRGDRELVLSR